MRWCVLSYKHPLPDPDLDLDFKIQTKFSLPHHHIWIWIWICSLLFQSFTYKSKNGLSSQEKLPALDLQQGFGGLLFCSQGTWIENLLCLRRHTGEIVYLKTPTSRTTHKGICSTGSQDNIPYSLALVFGCLWGGPMDLVFSKRLQGAAGATETIGSETGRRTFTQQVPMMELLHILVIDAIHFKTSTIFLVLGRVLGNSPARMLRS
ncbi:hypothetical protein M8C21_028171 [Ambrosia artemisiifolia]|uniref:Uncharacterized protein n=1 Tax=Ambrosia artemisiifolia TaxID=4212 RepID=A0AAD5CIS9_AMBAR|nr:hypothetical protein M8C21_028171 [Ambrosia artemisiifolia]